MRYIPPDFLDRVVEVIAEVEEKGGSYGNALSAAWKACRKQYESVTAHNIAKEILEDYLGWEPKI